MDSGVKVPLTFQIFKGNTLVRTRRPRPHAREPLAVDVAQDGSREPLIDPVLRRSRIVRINRKPLDELLARLVRRALECLEMRPGRLGIDVIGRYR